MSELKLSPGWLARDVARASERVASWRSDRSSTPPVEPVQQAREQENAQSPKVNER